MVVANQPAAIPCPDAEQLRLLLLGRLPDEISDRLEQHVQTCASCGSRLSSIPAQDELVEAVQSQRTLNDSPATLIALEQLTLRLHGLAWPGAASAACGQSGRHRAPVDTNAILNPPERDDEIGRLGPYRVLELLGQGGMGAVFRAEDPHLQRTVALKVMLPDVARQAAAREQFLREARAAAKIEHDHIVTIFQVGEDRGVPFVAMQLLKGTSLEDFLRQQESREAKSAVPVSAVLRIAREIAVGLAAAHAQSLVHRDVKPANIWLEAGSGRVKILDFGLAEPIADQVESQPTTIIAGTAAYMAPEQARGGPVDARTDLFSFGCVLYRLCTGWPPWEGRNPADVLAAVALREPTPVRDLNPAIPVGLADLIEQLLAKDPARRPQTADAVADLLRGIERAVNVTPRSDRRRVLPTAAAALAFLAFAAAAAVIYVRTDAGLLKIETLDDDVQVVVEKNGKVVEVIDRKQKSSIRLHSGKYDLKLEKPRPDVRLSNDRIEMTRDAEVIVKIETVAGPSVEGLDDARAIVNSLGMKLMPIPAGKFLMGSPPGESGRNNDEYQHEVVITKPFYLGAYCVSVGAFRHFIDQSSYRPEAGDAWSSPGYTATDNLPVGNVTWNDAVAFCKWLSKKEGRTYRLPTEAEWEYACRAGTTTPFFFGRNADLVLQYANVGGEGPRPSAPLKPNPWGLYDMYGNQWQWVADWYDPDYYLNSPKNDPQGPSTGINRMMRGSSHAMPARFARSALRHGPHPPEWYKPHVGFRVLLEQAPAKGS
jgi:serine/threonine protein kinase